MSIASSVLSVASGCGHDWACPVNPFSAWATIRKFWAWVHQTVGISSHIGMSMIFEEIQWYQDMT